jgi:hypothetical protein
LLQPVAQLRRAVGQSILLASQLADGVLSGLALRGFDSSDAIWRSASAN